MNETIPIKNAPLGNMNLDDDPHYIRNGDYGKAVGIRHISNQSGGTVGVEDVIGNRYAFTLPFVNLQDKSFRIYIDCNVVRNYQFDFRDMNNGPILTTSTLTTILNNFSATAINFLTQLTTDFAAVGLNAVIGTSQTGANNGYLDIGINNITGYDYVMTSVGPDVASFAVVAEAIDTGLSGQLQALAGYYVLGNLFIWSAVTDGLPIQITVANIINDGTGRIQLQFAAPHNLQNGESVTVNGALGTTNANGTWIIIVTSPTDIVLQRSIFNTQQIAAVGVTLTSKTDAIGEIGVVTKDEVNQVFAYTTLCRTKRWNFRLQRQIDTYLEPENNRWSMYWVDEYNPDRVFYYDGAFVLNGAIAALNTGGQYAYDTIYEETLLETGNVGSSLKITGMVYSGGALLSGNWRYAMRLVTQSGNETSWSDLVGPVNLFSKLPSAPGAQLQGDPDGTATTKQVQLTVSGLVVGLYQYVDIVAVHYNDLTVDTGIKIGRYDVTNDTIIIVHSGNETNTEDVQLATLNKVDAGYISSKSIDALDNRLIRSNLRRGNANFSDFAKSFLHTVDRFGMPTIARSVSNYGDSYGYGEYFQELNTVNRVGYMLNETYRFHAKIQLINGTIIETPFWIDDICIDTNVVNIGNVNNDNRRIAGLVDFSLTDAVPGIAFIPYIKFFFDPNFLVGGVPVKNIVRRIFIERVDMNDSFNEVITSGYLTPCLQAQVVGGNGNFISDNPDTAGVAFDHNAVKPIGISSEPFASHAFFEYMQMQVREMVSYPLPNDFESFTDQVTGWGGTGFGGAQKPLPRSNYAGFYSPDYFQTQRNVPWQIGDSVLCMMHQADRFQQWVGTYGINGGVSMRSDAKEKSCVNQATVHPVTIDEGYNMSGGAQQTFANGDVVSKRLKALYADNNLTVYNEFWQYQGSPMFKSNAAFFTATDGTVGSGWIYAQVFRNKGKGAKFGSLGSNKTVPTGAYIDLNSSSSASQQIDVFGGDCFTQRTYFHSRLVEGTNHTAQFSTSNALWLKGWGQGLTLYSQNRTNSQMRYPESGQQIYPVGLSVVGWLEDVFPHERYSHAYDIRNEINRNAEFNPNARQNTRFPTRFCWSEKKPNNSGIDYYRQTLPLSFKDLDEKYGEVIHHRVGNGELLSWQPYDFQMLRFNSNAVLSTADGTEALIGDGEVMRHKGTSLSSYGCKHKWAIIKGRSAGGHDTFYWPNTEVGRFYRFSRDNGTANITTIKKMRTFFRMGMKWADEDLTPASYYGIHGIWDERNSEAIWTVRSRRKVTNWNFINFLGIAVINDMCYVDVLPGGPLYSSFEQLPDIFVCIQAHVPNAQNRPLSNDPNPTWQQYWRQVSLDEHDFHNAYTVAYCEAQSDNERSGWRTFYPFRPKIFLQWKDTYLSPRPVDHIGRMYEHNEGDYLTWYEDNNASPGIGVEQAVDGEIDMPINYEAEENKGFVAILFNTLIVPRRIDFRTNKQISNLDQADFDYRKEEYVSEIRNDATVTATNPAGLNNLDTSPLYGTYLFSKLTFEKKVYQRLVSFIVHIRLRFRDKNR